MDLVFIRHGQGEHTLNVPSSLQLPDPSLTIQGIEQAKLLRDQLPLTNQDIIIISPIRRTIETTLIWSEHINCRKIVSPIVSPRMFPIRAGAKTLPCDKIISIEVIKSDFPTVEIDDNSPLNLWSDGINILPEFEFRVLAQEFIVKWKELKQDKVFIVSHDGTINSYRQMISGHSLSRKNFLQETEWVQIKS